MLPKFVLSVVLFLIIFNIGFSFSQNVTVNIPDGEIKGKTEVTKTNYTYYTFSGVRYAEPPVGNLRFKSPLPNKPWNGTYDATYEKNICFPISGDENNPLTNEDCLFLHIYTPEINDSLPVMVFIHGGGFENLNAGRGSYGPDFFMEYDIVLVTIQYRLGPFGFASTNDLVIPGNAGLKDQALALKWIQQNIQYFGGEPTKVTIFGESAGSASVSYHLLSDKSAGLFRAAIQQSGSALSAWAYQRDQSYYTFRTATFIDPNFSSNSSEDLLAFLLAADAKDIHAASIQVNNLETPGNHQLQQGFYYAPVIEPDHDDAFITNSMFESFKNGSYNIVPTIIGMNAEEGMMEYSSSFNQVVDALNNNETLLLPINMHIHDNNPNKTIVINAIEEFYGFSKNKTYEDQIAGTIRYLTDHCFARSIMKQAELQSNNYGNIYFYVFSYDGEMGDNPTTIPGTGNVSHGEELNYIFARSMYNSDKRNVDLDQFPEADQNTHYRLIQLWVNFAKTLNPTPEPDALFHYITWPIANYLTNALIYLDINEDLSLKTNPRWDAYTLWNDLYDKYAVEPLDSY